MFELNSTIYDKGLYLNNCISKEDIEKVLLLSKSEKFEIKHFRCGDYVEVNNQLDYPEKNIFEILNPITKKILKIYSDHFNKNLNDYRLEGEEVYWIKTWSKGSSIGFHSDSWDSKDGKKVPNVTILLYFTSDYEGGEVIFKNESGVGVDFSNQTFEVDDNDIKIKPLSGEAIVFDSNTVHLVTEVTGGSRICTDIAFV